MVVALSLGASVPRLEAASPSARVAADQTRLEQALGRLAAANRRVDGAEQALARNSAELDRLVSEQKQARLRLGTRARMMYRSGETAFISVLMNSRTYEDFASGWALLKRMNAQDAAMIRDLEAARKRAVRSARQLLALQARAARELDARQGEVSAARKRLASARAALAAYDRRVAATSRPSRGRSQSGSAAGQTPQVAGSGEWSTAVASHYGRNYSGGSASGEHIGPYSMVCAHKTLPFGTLVEFRYHGKRAVARVVDRGPFTPGRTFDLGPGVIRVLGFSGVDTVGYRIIGR